MKKSMRVSRRLGIPDVSSGMPDVSSGMPSLVSRYGKLSL
jgi:hypothetical protein